MRPPPVRTRRRQRAASTRSARPAVSQRSRQRGLGVSPESRRGSPDGRRRRADRRSGGAGMRDRAGAGGRRRRPGSSAATCGWPPAPRTCPPGPAHSRWRSKSSIHSAVVRVARMASRMARDLVPARRRRRPRRSWLPGAARPAPRRGPASGRHRQDHPAVRGRGRHRTARGSRHARWARAGRSKATPVLRNVVSSWAWQSMRTPSIETETFWPSPERSRAMERGEDADRGLVAGHDVGRPERAGSGRVVGARRPPTSSPTGPGGGGPGRAGRAAGRASP